MAVNDKNAMSLGVEVLSHTPEPLKYLNDNIHPCVRYISGGFAGHEWWMVATPYPDSDATVENPILYYGDSELDGTPPLSWSAGVVVEDSPATGYNSDGCIYYDGVGLWVFWRENFTPSTASRATFGVYTTNGTTFTAKKQFADLGFNVSGKTGDGEMCPIVVNFDGDINLYGTHYEFSPNRMPYGITKWSIADNNLVDNTFSVEKNIGLLYKEGFNFWHFDLFKHNSKYYCVVTPESGSEILLGVSEDGDNYTFYNTPLLSTSVAGTDYMYKPSAMVKDGILYVWHPNKIDGINRIFMTSGNFDDIIDYLESTISTIS